MTEMEVKMIKMETYIKELKSSILRPGLPVELMNELFASMPLENAFGLLAKMPNGLLARNIQKMINGMKEAMKNNKLNAKDCGLKLRLSVDGLQIKYSGSNWDEFSVRTMLPIPSVHFGAKPKIAFYFEVQLLFKLDRGHFVINNGFCDQQFPLEGGWLGCLKNSNSIGIVCKDRIFIDGSWIEFGNGVGWFNKYDFIGLGMIHLPNEKM